MSHQIPVGPGQSRPLRANNYVQGQIILTLAALSYVPIVGSMIAVGNIQNSENEAQQQGKQQEMARERKKHLMELYEKGKC